MNLIHQALESVNFQADCRGSTYVNNDGITVPRVTEILSKMIHKDALMYWANSLGFKGLRYKQVLENAANAGTLAHNAIEKFLNEKFKTNDNIPFLGFLSWYDMIIESGYMIRPIYVEHKLTCKWFGGTLDALMEIDGRIYLVDFKTSNHVTFTYFLQLAAYAYMLKEEGIVIDGVIVLQLNKEDVEFKEYFLDLHCPEHEIFFNHCTETFFSLAYAFYNVSRVEEEFKEIF